MNCTEFNRAYHGCVTINNKIYVLGGFDGDTFYNTVKCFDPITHKWEDKACMNFRRCYISVVNNSECRMTALKSSNILPLSPSLQITKFSQWAATMAIIVWTRLKCMILRRINGYWNRPCMMWDQMPVPPPLEITWGQRVHYFSSLWIMLIIIQIYIVGGFNGIDVLNSCEMYNTKTDIWTYCSFLENPRSGSSLVYCRNALYAIGGNSAFHRLTSVERFNMNTKIWEADSNMMTPRSNFATVVLGGTIYVMGGFNGTHTINKTESYTPTHGIAEW